MDMGHILVVEDEIWHQRPIKRAFEGKGHDLTFIDNGIDAVEWLKANKPDLALIDINIPGVDGIEVMKAAKAAGVMSLAMTTSDRHSDVKRAYEAGGYGYVVKPPKYEDVIAAIDGLTFHPNFRRLGDYANDRP